MNVLYAVKKSDEANQLLKNRQDKNRCDAMDDITYVSVDLVTHNVNYVFL
jgi:hypothetical protein